MLLKNGKFVTPDKIECGDLWITEGRIEAIDSHLPARNSVDILDLNGNIVIPGAIDAHVHFNEPGRADWEGWETGSCAALAGGITSVFEMPLNADPPTLTAERFREKKAVAEQKSCVDFGLWGGLTPINLDHLKALAEAGVIGFKAFMSSSGLDDFPRVDYASLKTGMKIIAETGKILALHAEDEALTQKLARQAKENDLEDIDAWLTSRPIEAELIAIREALELAKETGCRIHIVHISNVQGFELVQTARAEGVDVTAETCPHYLELLGTDLNEHGALAKCAPPLRDAQTRDALWEAVVDGPVDTIGSDHSPCLTSMKLDIPFSQAWGGISGIQHLLNPFIERILKQGDLSWERLVALSSGNVADRFGLEGRGKIIPGAQADLVVIDPTQETKVASEDLLYRNPHSPYIDRTWAGKIVERIIDGRCLSKNPEANFQGKIIVN